MGRLKERMTDREIKRKIESPKSNRRRMTITFTDTNETILFIPTVKKQSKYESERVGITKILRTTIIESK